jgi:transcriptional antiterminator Rof (Rho-off)
VEREDCIVISSVMCEGQVLQLGVQKGERKREKKEYLLAESEDKNCVLYLDKS